MPKTKKTESESKPIKKTTKKAAYIYAVGKRKTSSARVRLYPKVDVQEIEINQKKLENYLPYFEYQKKVQEPLKTVGLEKYKITVKVAGGGLQGQAEAIRHGIARALLELNADYKKILKPKKYLTRDSRKKERKKPGLKRARRAPQWQKR